MRKNESYSVRIKRPTLKTHAVVRFFTILLISSFLVQCTTPASRPITGTKQEDPANFQNISTGIKVVASSQVYKGYEIEKSLDDNTDSDYSAAFENPLPHFFTLEFSPIVHLDAVFFLWESPKNYAIDYKIESIDENGKAQLLALVTDQKEQKQWVSLGNGFDIKQVRITVIRTAGQQRLLMRQVKFFTRTVGNPPVIVDSSPGATKTSDSSTMATIPLPTPNIYSQPPDFERAKRDVNSIYGKLPPIDPPKGKCIDAFISVYGYLDYPAQAMYALDPNGILQTNYGDDFSKAGLQDNPWSIAAYGMAGIKAWCKTKDEVGLKIAIQQADWLINNLVYDGSFGKWIYHFPNSAFNAPAGWSSSFGNGYGIAFLTQAYVLTLNEKYKNAVDRVVKSFGVDTRSGGVRSDFSGSPMYEEVAHPDAAPAHILNAHIRSIEALDYTAKNSGNSEAEVYTQQGIETFRKALNVYDADVTTLYALNAFYASQGPVSTSRSHYAHYIHIDGAYWAYQKTGDPIFLEYMFRWFRYTQKFYDMDISVKCLGCSPVEIYPSGNYIAIPKTEKNIYFDLKKIQYVTSFGYNSLGAYPTNYSVSFSVDGKNWTEKIEVSNTSKSSGVNIFDGISARYARLTINAINDDKVNNLVFGVFRFDGKNYWEDPLVVLCDESMHVINDSSDTFNYFTDNSLQSGVTLESKTDILYGDIRKLQSPKSITIYTNYLKGSQFSGKLEVSEDLGKWSVIDTDFTVSDDGNQINISLKNRGIQWQYFRIMLTRDPGISIFELKIEK